MIIFFIIFLVVLFTPEGFFHMPYLFCVSILLTFLISNLLVGLPIPSIRYRSLYNYLRYFVWLLGSVIASSIDVTKLIWGIKNRLSNKIIWIEISVNDINKKILYANSITLTPGTISIDIEDNNLLVHTLHKDFAKELCSKDMENKILLI